MVQTWLLMPLILGLTNMATPVVPGNIDLSQRRVLNNSDGTISTIETISVNFDGREVLLPTISPEGVRLTEDEAVDLYRRTGQHLGIFDTPQEATDYARQISQEQGQRFQPSARTTLTGTVKERVETALQHPNVQAFLNVIAQAEGTTREGQNENGYNVLVGGSLFGDYSDHPNRRISLRSGNNVIQSTAAGRYQITRRTWNEAAKQLGLTDFSPSSQDAAAVYLLNRRGALDDVINGDAAAAISKIGSEWAAFPTSPYDQPTREWDQINGWLEQQGFTPVGSEAERTRQLMIAQAQAQGQSTEGIPTARQIESGEVLRVQDQEILAIPQTDEERGVLRETRSYDDELRLRALQLEQQFAEAKQLYTDNTPLFSPLPRIFDDDIRQILNNIDRIENPTY